MMINVYFVQHALAQPKDIDEKRPLTDLGVEETIKVAQKLKEQGIIIHKIVHSGKLRAAQTADLFSKTLEIENVSELDGMNPNDNAYEFLPQITENAVMYIGHLPNIQKIVAALICSDENCNAIQFQNSSIACIEIDGNKNSLKWFITPNLC